MDDGGRSSLETKGTPTIHETSYVEMLVERSKIRRDLDTLAPTTTDAAQRDWIKEELEGPDRQLVRGSVDRGKYQAGRYSCWPKSHSTSPRFSLSTLEDRS